MAKFFDVIVVGAGPAGSMAAFKLARAGVKVALLERGAQPGSKNVFGGLLHHSPVLNETFPDFVKRAPLERHVHQKTLAFMTARSSVNVAFATENFGEQPYNGYTVMRPIFDRWLAEEAVAAGALLLTGCTVDNVTRTKGRVSGVTVKGRPGELHSNIVIAADGVLSFLAQRAGLRSGLNPRQLGLGVKFLLGMPHDLINERFGLSRDEGADYALLGLTGRVGGGAFLYTNLESVSFGMVLHLDSLRASGAAPYDPLNQALEQPQLKKLLKGAVSLEYSAHLIPEAGFAGIPRVYTGGMLVAGDAAGLCYANGINLEGINLAIASGAMAAETAVQALHANDFSARILSSYKKRLDASFVIKDMMTFKNAPEMLRLERLSQGYPELLCAIFEKMYRVDGGARDRILKMARQQATGRIRKADLAKDMLKVARALL